MFISLYVKLHVALFSGCTFSVLHIFFILYSFHVAPFFMLHSFRVPRFPCCTFFTLHSFHVALFSYCILFILHLFFEIFLFCFCCDFSCCTFFVSHYLNVAVISSCTFFMLCLFSYCSLFILNFLRGALMSHLFSCYTIFMSYRFLHFFHVVSFFVLHSFYASPFFLLRSFLGLVLFMMHFFSFAYPLGWHSFHAAIFLCYTFFSLDLNFWPFSCFTHFMMPFFSLLSFTLRTFHIALFHVALISCCKFLLLYSLHITPSQGVKMAPKPKLHLIMHLPQWVFKTAGLPRTLSVFL